MRRARRAPHCYMTSDASKLHKGLVDLAARHVLVVPVLVICGHGRLKC